VRKRIRLYYLQFSVRDGCFVQTTCFCFEDYDYAGACNWVLKTVLRSDRGESATVLVSLVL
jgi:hypothetical protein